MAAGTPRQKKPSTRCRCVPTEPQRSDRKSRVQAEDKVAGPSVRLLEWPGAESKFASSRAVVVTVEVAVMDLDGHTVSQ